MGDAIVHKAAEVLIDSVVMLHRQIHDLKMTVEHHGRLISTIGAVLDGEEPPAYGTPNDIVMRIYNLITAYDELLDKVRKIEGMLPAGATRDFVRGVILREESR